MLDTLDGDLALRSSAAFETLRQIGDVTGEYERIKVQAHTKILGVVNDLLGTSEPLKNFAGTFLMITENLGRVMGAVSLFAFGAFGVMQIIGAAGGIGGAGVFGLLGTMMKGFLGLIVPVIGFALAFSAGIFLITDRLARLGNSGPSAFLTISELADTFADLVLPLMLGQEMTAEMEDMFLQLSDQTQQTLGNIIAFTTFLRGTFSGVIDGIKISMGVLIDVFDLIAFGIGNFVLFLSQFLGGAASTTDAIKEASDAGTGFTAVFKDLGKMLGVVLGPLLFFTLITRTASLVFIPLLGSLKFFNTLLFGSAGAVTLLGKAFLFFLGIGKDLIMFFSIIQLSTLALVGVFIGVIAALYGVYRGFVALIDMYNTAIANGETLWAVLYGLGMLLLGGLGIALAVVAGLMIKMAIAAAIAAVSTALLSFGITGMILPIVLVVGGILLLIYALKKVIDFFWSTNDAAEATTAAINDQAEATKGLADAGDELSGADTPVIGLQDANGAPVTAVPESTSVGGAVDRLRGLLPEGVSQSLPDTDSLLQQLPGTSSGLPASPALPSMPSAQPQRVDVHLRMDSMFPATEEDMRRAARTIVPFLQEQVELEGRS